jgi:hypothetical protein
MYRAAVRAGFYSDWPVAQDAVRPQSVGVSGSDPDLGALAGAV